VVGVLDLKFSKLVSRLALRLDLLMEKCWASSLAVSLDSKMDAC